MALLICACAADPVDLDPKQEIDAGNKALLRYGFDQAEQHYAAARTALTEGSSEWIEATLGLAIALHHQVPIDADRINERAAPLYEEVFSRGGTTEWAARAALHRGRIAEQRDVKSDASDLDLAREWYVRVIQGWVADSIAGEATVRMAATHLQTGDPDQVRIAIGMCEARAAAYPKQPWAATLWEMAGNAWWVQLRDADNAVRCLKCAVDAGLPDPSTAWIAAWRIASISESIGNREDAVRFYRRVIEEHLTSGKAWEAQERLRALGVEPPTVRRPLELGADGAGQ